MKKLLFLLLIFNVITFALQPPAENEVAILKASGTWDAQLARAKMYGNHRVKPQLAQRTLAKLGLLSSDGEQINTPLPNWQGMPTTGTNKVLFFLIDFPDKPHASSYDSVTNQLFGAGNSGNYPEESLQRYYWRASYGKLLIEGDALGWYEMQHNRDWYTNTYGTGNYANYMIVKEVAEHYNSSVDYSEYDNNSDGEVDYFAVIWAGEHGAWASFWWGYQWSLYSANLTLDGVRFYDFSWQWDTYSYPSGSFNPEVVIHETGHALGLPDYYDYNGTVGPDGGVGNLDMMDGNWGDHNCFSKFMLDWLTPTVVTTNLYDFPMRAAAQYPDAVAVMPLYTGADPYSEYFMIQNRYKTLNDSTYPANGLLIWHVDATPNWSGTDFLYDNSYASHKLLRLMEADGLEEIEMNRSADAGDYYDAGEVFDDISSPNSKNYAGASTMVSVSDISADGVTMTADIEIIPEPGFLLILFSALVIIKRVSL